MLVNPEPRRREHILDNPRMLVFVSKQNFANPFHQTLVLVVRGTNYD